MIARRGFALMAVLWIITGAAITGMTVSLAARERIHTALNRNAMLRAEWAAEDCLARATAALDRLVDSRAGRPGAPAPAESLPLLVVRDLRVAECPGAVRLLPAGMAVDLGSATAEVLRRVLTIQGLPSPSVDSLVDAVLDWRDPDDVPRAHGCERACYASLERVPPRNASFADVGELALVRGFESWEGDVDRRAPLERLFTTEAGRVALTWAPYGVLAGLPGIGRVGARDIIEHRLRRDAAFGDLASIGRVLSPVARDSFMLGFDRLARLATVTPDAWQLTVIAPRPADADAIPPLGVRLVARLSLGADGVRVQRRRFVP